MLEHYRIEDWREMLVAVNRQIKANQTFESVKISGLLMVALDANEQFHSRCRCCPDCGQRRVEAGLGRGQRVQAGLYNFNVCRRASFQLHFGRMVFYDHRLAVFQTGSETEGDCDVAARAAA